MVPKGKTVTMKWYAQKCLRKVFAKFAQTRPVRGLQGLQLHHDNCSSHTGDFTTAYLGRKRVKETGHPAYSPDLAPCDFFLNPGPTKLPAVGVSRPKGSWSSRSSKFWPPSLKKTLNGASKSGSIVCIGVWQRVASTSKINSS